MKERIRRSWLTKDEFSCSKCNASGKDIGWNDRNSKHPKGQPEDVLFCKKCGHELREKEELEELVAFVEYREFGFYLRFASGHFIPCRKCQEDLDKAFNTKGLRISAKNTLILERNDGEYTFVCAFIRAFPRRPKVGAYLLVPCKKCQKVLEGVIENKELHLGNDVKPPVEFWAKWKINNKKMMALEKGRIIEVNGNPFGKCSGCNKEKYLKTFNKLRMCFDCDKRITQEKIEADLWHD